MWQIDMVSIENLYFLAAGFCAGIIICLILQKLGLSLFAKKIKSMSVEALQLNSGQFLDLADKFFAGYVKEARRDFDIKGDEILKKVDPVQEALEKYEQRLSIMEREREKEFGSLTSRLFDMAKTQQNLRKETGNLVKALRLPHVRGRWGELTLKRVAEIAGMADQCDFVEQPSTGSGKGSLRPDMIVHLPEDRNIIIDSKVPLSAYLDALEAETKEEKKKFLKNHAKQVQNHVTNLSQKKYWQSFSPCPEFVVLFIPGENYFSAALAINPNLIEAAIAKGVVLATPTTLISLLKAVSYGWKQEQSAKNAKEISKLGTELFQRLSSMSENMNKLGRDIEKAASTYNKTIGSLEQRVMVSARKFTSLGISPGSDAELSTIEHAEAATRKMAQQDT
ncbi:MAG: DNA recombination protein RmuC [Thermodesulfobacteriota bacterium]|nr:DNA recombination protein RmuC [Thermodesulfobacteriota bacterium]